jgi:signal transduction histidine kinase
VVVGTLALVASLLAIEQPTVGPEVIFWVLTVAIVELLPVPFWRGLQMSMGFPILLATGFLYPPAIAGLVALVGSCDPREFRREVAATTALFNRAQVAISVLGASLVFHQIASIRSSVPWVLLGAIAATVSDYLANQGLVTAWVTLLHGLRPLEVMRKLRIGHPAEFLLSYLALGLLAIVLAELFQQVGFWSVAALLAPLVFARQMFFRSRALEAAHKELKVREQVLQALSDRMAEERQDERAQIAAYLHDDLAQLLFRMSLQVDLARRHLSHDDSHAIEQDLEAIRETKNRTSELIRALIRDLHRSPLGRAGLAEALQSFTGDLAKGADIRFHTRVAPIALPPAIQLIAYHIAREAAMNSLKHSGASNVWITLESTDEGAELSIRDDGSGFDADPEVTSPEGHFGLNMMRERAHVAGGSFHVESVPGEGTLVRVRFPTEWIQKDAPPLGPEKSDDRLSPVAEPAPARGASRGTDRAGSKGSNREVVPA